MKMIPVVWSLGVCIGGLPAAWGASLIHRQSHPWERRDLASEMQKVFAAGARASSSQLPTYSASSATHANEEVPSKATRRLPARRLLGWIGRFHILAVHFPIALLMAAAVGEMWALWRGIRSLEPAVRFCVLLGAGGATFAAALGWLHADLGGYGAGSGQLLSLHRWIGTVAGLWALGIAWLSERDAWHRRRSALFRITLWTGAFLVAGAAHLGGALVHGGEFFDW